MIVFNKSLRNRETTVWVHRILKARFICLFFIVNWTSNYTNVDLTAYYSLLHLSGYTDCTNAVGGDTAIDGVRLKHGVLI